MLAELLNNLALVLSEMARATGTPDEQSEAQALYRRALLGRESALGASHPDTLKTAEHLAYSLHSQGKHAEADQLVTSLDGSRAAPDVQLVTSVTPSGGSAGRWKV